VIGVSPAPARSGLRRIDVPHDPRGARLARRWLASELAPTSAADLVADASVVVAELVSNAVQHAAPLPGDVIRVCWRLRTGRGQRRQVEIRVSDGGAPQPPQPRPSEPDAVSGRGLGIVSALAVRWGVDQEGTGQCVWAVLGSG
jgi:anti-sigma regulatory factor (Ser/Thr protein kinase)